MPIRPALLLAPALVLAACEETHTAGGKRDAPTIPIGFEMAFARTAAAGDDAKASAPAAPPLIDLTPAELAEKLKAGHVRLIDVRTAEEVAEGTIPGAEHMPLDQFDPAKLNADDGREIVLYCRSGRRSAMAGAMLAEVTGQAVQHLAGGIMAWEAAGRPIAKR